MIEKIQTDAVYEAMTRLAKSIDADQSQGFAAMAFAALFQTLDLALKAGSPLPAPWAGATRKGET